MKAKTNLVELTLELTMAFEVKKVYYHDEAATAATLEMRSGMMVLVENGDDGLNVKFGTLRGNAWTERMENEAKVMMDILQVSQV